MQMYYYCDVIACLIQGCRIIHTVTWLFLGYGFLVATKGFVDKCAVWIAISQINP